MPVRLRLLGGLRTGQVVLLLPTEVHRLFRKKLCSGEAKYYSVTCLWMWPRLRSRWVHNCLPLCAIPSLRVGAVQENGRTCEGHVHHLQQPIAIERNGPSYFSPSSRCCGGTVKVQWQGDRREYVLLHYFTSAADKASS